MEWFMRAAHFTGNSSSWSFLLSMLFRYSTCTSGLSPTLIVEAVEHWEHFLIEQDLA